MILFMVAVLAACLAVFTGTSAVVMLFVGLTKAGFVSAGVTVILFAIFVLVLRRWDRL